MYNTLIDDLVPIVDGLRLLRAHSNGKASTYLLRAVCLISAKANQAGPFLRLVENEEVLTCSRFTECLRIGLEAAMHAGLERDRIVRIQVLALLHLHNDGSGGPARASKSLAAAISEAWAIPIHFPVSDDPNAEQYAMLWWSLRNLDRLNKPVMGCAPFMIDDTDIRLDRVALRVGDYRSELMVVSTRLGDLMAHATKAYKASYRGTADVEGPWPPFSDITADVRLDLMHQAHREYLETWYHVAGMLSCRFGGPSTAQYERRISSADRVIALLADKRFERLPPLPLVPYAMTLATTNIFRAFRDGRRDAACTERDLGICRTTLSAMRTRWTSARIMTRPVAREPGREIGGPSASLDPAATSLGTWRPLAQTSVVSPTGQGSWEPHEPWFAPNIDPLSEDWSLLFDGRLLQGGGEMQDYMRFYELFNEADNPWPTLSEEGLGS